MAKLKKEKLPLEELLEQSLIKDEDKPYQIPENWVWTYVKSVAVLHRGVTYRKTDVTTEKKEDSCLVLRGGNIKEEQLIFEDNVYVNLSLIKKEQFIKENDVVIVSSTGSTKVIGRAGIADCDYNKVAFGAFLTLVRGCNNVNKKYTALFFQTNDYRNTIRVLAKGVNINNIKNEYIENLSFPLPPHSEQQRIISVIGSLFEKLDTSKQLTQNALDSFENRQAAILHKAFTGELTAKWREKNGVSLDDWKETSLSTVVIGFKYGSSEKSDALYTGIPVIRIPNVGPNAIDFNNMKYLNHFNISEENQIKENDILIIRSNGSRNLVGKCALVGKLNKPYTFASYLIRIRPCNINSQYLLYLLNSSYVRKQFFDKSKSSAGINNINAKELGSVKIPLPLLEEQKEIIRILDNLLANEQLANELCDVIDKIDIMKKAILARAFRGELGTNEPGEESAVELLKEILKEKCLNNRA